MKSKNKYFYLYLFFVKLLGAICFYCGFFPASTSTYQFSTMDDFPNITLSDTTRTYTYKKHYDKLVIIVIDSLRYDFVAIKNNSQPYFPYLNNQLNDKNSCLLKARVHSPTVTLPRIKSLLTGTVPGFLDVVANFGQSQLNSDNILYQAKKSGLKTIFFGDETWISLLPYSFERSEGTTSFFVSDFIEVDLNVTRNVKVEIDNDDWDIMILHYLGLDHIGHLEGPRSKLVRPKLLEMDNVISLVNEKFKRTNKNGLIVVCGDHGMKDSGGHGGTTLAEVLIPVAILNYECNRDSRQMEIRQIDIAPLLSVILGLPIPADSIGKLNYKILNGLDKHHSLYALFYNTKRLVAKILEYNLNETNLNDDIEKGINKGVEFFKLFINNNHSYSDYLNSAKYFSYIQEVLSDRLVKLNITYDVNLMILGMLLFLQSLIASIFGNNFLFRNFNDKLLITFALIVFLHYTFCYLSNSSSATCSFSAISVTCISIIYIVIFINLVFIDYSRKLLTNITLLNVFFLAGTLLHIVSLTSSSYIEEEHQFWYFISVTFFLFFITFYKRDIIGFSSLLFCHRILRYLNQTGDKWASSPDLEDWLMTNDFFYLLSLSIFSLFCTFLYTTQLVHHISSPYLTNFLTICQFLCIFFYKTMSGSLKITHLEVNQSLGIIIVRCFWLITLVKSVVFFRSLKKLYKLSYNKLSAQLIGFLLDIILMIICLLYKPHNLILIPALLFYSHILVKNFKNDTFPLIYIHYWLGTIFYFYQGNSNSISTIDVTPGYVGLENFNFFITGIFIALNTYSAPLLAFLLLLRALAVNSKLIDCQAEIYHITILIYSAQLIVYSFIMIIQRHHIFIWSVFAPKLLYILANTVLNFVLISTSVLIVFLSNIIADHSVFSYYFERNKITKNR